MQPVLDFRCRPPFQPFTSDWIFDLEDRPGNDGLKSKYARMNMTLPASLLETSMSLFLEEQAACNIVRSVVPLRVLPTQKNEDLVSLLQGYPERFIGLAGVQPALDGVDASLSAMERYIVQGPCRGVYMEPGLDPVPWLVDDETWFPLYDFCQQENIPVCLLFGGVFHRQDAPDYSFYFPMRVETIARAFPRLRIALSHAAWPWTTAACALAINYKNVFLSSDGFMIDHPGAQDYIVAANYRLQDKIIFGSLYPAAPMPYAVQRYSEVLRPEVLSKVFFQNAVTFLGSV